MGKMNQWKIQKKKICISSFLMIFRFHQHLEKKTGKETGGNWKFFCKIDIKEMAAIFQCSHNG